MPRLQLKLLLLFYITESGGDTEDSNSVKQMYLIRKDTISKAENIHIVLLKKVTLSMDGYYIYCNHLGVTYGTNRPCEILKKLIPRMQILKSRELTNFFGSKNYQNSHLKERNKVKNFMPNGRQLL